MADERIKNQEIEQGKPFHIGDILSITTGRLVSPRHIDGVYDILNYMTGDDLMTHQLPRASEQCRPYLIEQHPELEGVDASQVNSENWQTWLNEQIAKFGQELPVQPVALRNRIVRDPIAELREMVGPNKPIMVINPENLSKE